MTRINEYLNRQKFQYYNYLTNIHHFFNRILLHLCKNILYGSYYIEEPKRAREGIHKR